MIKILSVAIVVVIFSGCSLKDTSKPIKEYTIEDSTKISSKPLHVDKVLKISKLKASSYLQNSSIWYKREDYETSPYIYSQWNENFVDMIEKDITNTIFKSNIFKTTFSRYSKIRADLLLEADIIEARQNIYENSSDVTFKIVLYLIDEKSSKVVGNREFSYTKDCENVDAQSAILAYNEVIKNLNKDMITWLKTLVKEN
ncbi:MAG: ABC-type transport auxiliary lipoprotein family protein [Campylobacterota bacterium]|nr:ABC-type transport auxiliary lipoprotein family protein [Campylobacterota bacterium]